MCLNYTLLVLRMTCDVPASVSASEIAVLEWLLLLFSSIVSGDLEELTDVGFSTMVLKLTIFI